MAKRTALVFWPLIDGSRRSGRFHLNYALALLICFLPGTLFADPHGPQLLAKARVQPKHDFAFVIECDWTKKTSNICLLGKYERGIRATLLEIEKSRVCVAKTEESGDYEGPVVGHLPFTMISGPKCQDPDLYSIAVLNHPVGNYQLLQLQEVINKNKVQDLDKFVRSRLVLEKLRTKAGKAEEYELSNELPIVHRYPIPKLEAFIVSYKKVICDELTVEGVRGPRAIIVNGVAFPLTGWCSYPYLRAFRLDGQYYLESGSNCCDCGITIKEIFQIKSTGPIEVHSDGRLSD